MYHHLMIMKDMMISDCFPDVEESLTEEDYKRFEGKNIWVRNGWSPALLKKEIEYIIDEIDFSASNEEKNEPEEGLDISRITFQCDNSISGVAMASFLHRQYLCTLFFI